MFFIAWTNKTGRTDVGAVRSAALLYQLKERGVIPQVIDLWEPGCIYSKAKWMITTLKKLIKNRKQLVYVSCSPYNHLLIILLGVWLGNHKLIIDFRDAYSLDIKDRNFPGNYRYASIIEKLVYRFCDKFILVTPGLKNRYEKIFKNADKIMVVPNGHELSKEFLEMLVDKKNNSNLVKIVYPGIYAPYFTDNDAIDYIERLKNVINSEGKECEIIFIGTDKHTKELFKNDNSIKFVPNTNNNERLPYKNTIQILNDADLTFVPIKNDYGCATKIYDYLALGLPIYNFINNENWLHQYVGDRIVDSCKDLCRFEKDFNGKYHRMNQMKKLTDYICDEVIKLNDPALLK